MSLAELAVLGKPSTVFQTLLARTQNPLNNSTTALVEDQKNQKDGKIWIDTTRVNTANQKRCPKRL